MRVLLIKTSSMGDLIHTLPALTDAAQAIAGLQFDWVVEEPFVEIPHWHPAVKKVIPVALRRWRKSLFSKETRQALANLRREFNSEQYDLIIDAQGLVKSALITLFARGERAGLDWKSARESLASLAYSAKHTVNFYQHAIVRMRLLFSQALHYAMPTTPPEFGLTSFNNAKSEEPNYVVFLHGTTWNSKLWPQAYWADLANIAANANFRIKIGGGNQEEVERARSIARQATNVDVMPFMGIEEMAKVLANAAGVVAVDTGFGHLAAALNVPIVSLYGSTNPEFTGAIGKHSRHLAATFECSPCYSRNCHYQEKAACYRTLPPPLVWDNLTQLMR